MARRKGSSLVSLCAALLVVGTVSSTLPDAVQAQPAATKQAAPKAKPKAPEFLEPVEEKIEVKEGAKLTMMATYYPSKLGKEAVPVLLLHGYEGTRADYEHLALYLQQQGHAVLVPDLRGHGDSTVLLFPNGERKEIEPKKMTPRDFNQLVADLDAIKSWLLKKNNEEEFNLEMLTVVGADMTTVTAMNFALRDWEAPELLSYKNCKDVKALVLLSPDQNWRGTSMKLAMKHGVVGHKLSVLVAVGKKDSAALGEAKRLVTALERQHGEATAEKRPEEKEIVFYAADTNLQGTKLVARNLDVVPIIGQFIEFRVKALADEFEYSPRIKP